MMASRRWHLLTALLALAVLVVISFSLLLQGARVSAARMTPAPTDARLAGAYRFTRGGWTYVHLQGSPDQIGFQHGYLLAPEIADAFAAVKLDDTHNTKKDWGFFRHAAHDMLWPHIDAEYQAELKGITEGLNAHGVKMTLDDVVALNAFEELPDYYVPWYDKKNKIAHAANIKVKGHCSAFVATGSWTKDGRIMFDIVPQHGYRMIMDGFPGVITSDDDFGINSDGLMVTETTISDFHGWNPDGIPEFVRSRKALQYAGSIDDYVKIMLDGNNGGYANDWLLGDRKTGEIAQFELGLKGYKLWRTKDGAYSGSNWARDPKVLREDAPEFKPNDLETSPNARRVRWEQLLKENKGKIDVDLAEKMLGDHVDSYHQRRETNERTLCGHVDSSPRGIEIWGWGPYFPGGAVQGKATDSEMTKEMKLVARAG